MSPSRSTIGMFAGSSDSPMWKRGWRSRSSSVTVSPRRASSIAAVEPAGPPPMTRTSLRGCGGLTFGLLLREKKRPERRFRPRMIYIRRPSGDGSLRQSIMPTSQSPAERELAALIVSSLNLEAVKPEDLDPEAALFGPELGLDSIDALELRSEERRVGKECR